MMIIILKSSSVFSYIYIQKHVYIYIYIQYIFFDHTLICLYINHVWACFFSGGEHWGFDTGNSSSTTRIVIMNIVMSDDDADDDDDDVELCKMM